MALRKQTVTHNGAPLKGKDNSTARGHSPPPAVDQQDAIEDVGSSSSQEAAVNFQLHEGQIFYMLTDMKEQQAQSNCIPEQAALDCENAIVNKRC